MPVAELSIAGEAFWRELKTHLEWSEGFELFFFFTNNPQISALLIERIKGLYRDNACQLYYFAPSQPDTLIADALGFIQSTGSALTGLQPGLRG